MTTLKCIDVPGFGRYVCGRKKSELSTIPRFTASAQPQVFHDVDAIRTAAKNQAIYAAVEDLLGNNKWGDCTCAAALKMQAIFDSAAGHEYRAPTLNDALWLYSKVSVPPFDPSTGANDNGAELQTVLTFWQSHGLYQDGHGKIKAAYAVDGTNKAQVMDALNTNGLLYAGCDIPDALEDITGTGFVWDMEGPPDPNAGHCTYIYGYNETGVFDGTWGMEGTITWEALAYYFGGQTGELYTVVPA